MSNRITVRNGAITIKAEKEGKLVVVSDLYAGFWKRFLACIIDAIIVNVLCLVIIVLGVISIYGTSILTGTIPNDLTAGITTVLIMIAAYIFPWLYYALMESSDKQATLGKMAVGIIVTDENNNRISFGKASGRFFAKIVSALALYIGFIMVGFTRKKQGLHDIMATCLVLNKNALAAEDIQSKL